MDSNSNSLVRKGISFKLTDGIYTVLVRFWGLVFIVKIVKSKFSNVRSDNLFSGL